ncbi:peptide/nickel transport system permease protein [Methanomicrobium sp. W14]|uniref:ABC transporter permease n=1 Tax=Methanomicrobium sp. W14 TaxID=2817839 RepID=UPI001AE9B879|nr:ABC transporter permease [Methanomicrobium sp. W14]MBP2134406.1 peptide/nickel transport system permease protein [Methanomicrobium sp. W14]
MNGFKASLQEPGRILKVSRENVNELVKSFKSTFSKFSIEGKIGVAGLFLIVMMAVFAPLITVYPPDKITGDSLESPDPGHVLGTDELGMDIWSQVCYGARMSLTIGLAVAFIAGFGGGALGILAGYRGGIFDEVLMRVIDVTMALPSLPLLIVISAFLGPSIVNVIIILVLFSWAKPARLARSQTLSIKKNSYIVSARMFGAKPFYLLRKHIFPEVLPILLVLIIGISSHAIVAETGLAFLGLGDPTSKSWGMMINYATSFRSIYFTPYWQWWLLPPLFMLIFLLLCLAFISRDMERVLDPKLLRKTGGKS